MEANMQTPFWMNSSKALLSPKELADLLGISVRSIYNQTAKASKIKFPIPYIRVGKLIRFHVRDVEKFLNNSKQK
jgi:excisionase family DNA binding protein